jgi:hypothetical protein
LHRNFPNAGLVIDISRDAPPYTGEKLYPIENVKIATTSKIPPTRDEVQR